MKQLSLSFAVGLFVAGVAFACSSSDDTNSSSNNAAGQTPEQLFRAIQPDLVKNCGGVNGACHVDGTPRTRKAIRRRAGSALATRTRWPRAIRESSQSQRAP